VDPVALIVTALAAGAVPAVRAEAPDAVTGAYGRLTDAVRMRLAGHPEGKVALARYQADPQMERALLAAELDRAGAGNDAGLMSAALAVMELVDVAAAEAWKYAVTISGSHGVLVGNDNTQFNYFLGEHASRRGPAAAAAGAGTVVVGDVPQEPVAFHRRAGLMGALEQESRGRVSVVFAVTGIRGVGKTQVAAAYARRRIDDGWRLVAWVDASEEASAVAGLAQVAVAAGVGLAGEDARVLAAGVRHWLEADGARRLVVFDNAGDLDGLRPFLPAAGAAQVVITSTRRSMTGLGTPVAVDVFTEGEALGFLVKRTGLDDGAGARELAVELGFLPLGLAQAAAVIAREHLGYGTYLKRLRALPVADYLRRVEGDAYPYRVAEAIMLSLCAAEAGDPSGGCTALMGLVSVLAETGVSRRLLHLAASVDPDGGGQGGTVAVDAAAGLLADASLLGFTLDDSVVARRLVMRVVRERLANDDGLAAAVAGAVQAVGKLADEIAEAWRDPSGVRELADHVNALTVHVKGFLEASASEVPAGLLRLRLRSVYLLERARG
jgi:roadblock/LC7 domain-containing protein